MVQWYVLKLKASSPNKKYVPGISLRNVLVKNIFKLQLSVRQGTNIN